MNANVDTAVRNARFDDARLLADHAGRHASLVKELADRESGCFGNFRVQATGRGRCRYSIDVVGVVSPLISLYGADALHNMRSAMELSIWAAASFVEGAQAKKSRLKFPHGETREAYLDGIGPLVGLLPERAIEFLQKGVDLYRRDIPLHPVFPINNSNKHRELIPIAFDVSALALERRGTPQQFIRVPTGLGSKLGTIDLGEHEGPPAEGMTTLLGIRLVGGGKLGPTTMVHMVEQTRGIVDGLASACALPA